MGENSVINSREISGLIQRTLNQVDSRLVDHGRRVAFLVGELLRNEDEFTEKDKNEIAFLALLHDIGAYKTEEIDRMAQFEADDVWEHSVYGYLFIYHLSMLKEWAPAVLYHHTPYAKLPGDIDEKVARVAQFVRLADRVDMLSLQGLSAAEVVDYIRGKPESSYCREVVNLLIQAEEQTGIIEKMKNPESLYTVLECETFSRKDIDSFLKLVIYAIDFRSQHTVTHTMTTTSIACCIGELMGMSEKQTEELYYGALLHDLGKIGIPVEILEFPGKLSPQAMNIMRTHVDITRKILGEKIDPTVTEIAVRHHEKLDGTGYPMGLKEEDMTLEEEIVAVSDMASALIGTRSYKSAFSREKTLEILEEQKNSGKLNNRVVDVLHENFDQILESVEKQCRPVLKTYLGLQKEYMKLISKQLSGNYMSD